MPESTRPALTPTERRLVDAAIDLGPKASLTGLARAAGLDYTGDVVRLRRRLRSMKRWPHPETEEARS